MLKIFNRKPVRLTVRSEELEVGDSLVWEGTYMQVMNVEVRHECVAVTLAPITPFENPGVEYWQYEKLERNLWCLIWRKR